MDNGTNAEQLPSYSGMSRTLPNSLEAEVAVLGSMLIAPEAASLALSALNFDGAFYRGAHQTIFNAMLELNPGKSEAALDPVVLADHLERSGRLDEVGGRAYLSQLMDSVPTAANIEHYVDIVREKAILRKLIKTCAISMDKCYDADNARDVLDAIGQSVFDITSMNQTKEIMDIKQLSYDALEYLNKLMQGDQEVLGLRTGFDFDRLITGLKPGELFVLAARPSIGKTALAMNMALNIALSDPPVPVGIFSLEMPARQLVLRFICSMTNISMKEFRKRLLTNEKWCTVMETVNKLSSSTILIDDTGAIDILELRAKARRMKANNDVKVIFIDYLQLIKGQVRANASRENEVAMISGSLKAMAKELNIPVVVLAQLNRQAEQPGDTPKLSNLRESGAIEQDADVVALLHRDRKQQYDQKDGDEAKPLPAELIIAKNRNGGTGTVDLLFTPAYTRFDNVANMPDENATEG